MEFPLYREYKDIVGQFSYVVETERRLPGQQRRADPAQRGRRGLPSCAWPMPGSGTCTTARFVKQVRVITFKDVNIEEVEKPELRLPE